MLNSNLNKNHIINNLSNKTGLSKNFSKKLIDDLLSILLVMIKNGNLNLKNIGSFKIIKKKERIGRNPKTKKEFIVSARKSVSFTPSSKLSKNLNNNYE